MGISPEQFQALQQKTAGRGKAGKAKSSRKSAGTSEVAPVARPVHQVILGVDPSLRGTGYGVIRLATPVPETLAQGTIKCPPKWELSRCLVQISQTLRDVVAEHRPTGCAVEGIFHAQNLKTAIVMGEARGAAIAAVAEGGVEIHEIAARKVKLAIVGYGGAQKPAVAKMVQRMLDLAEEPAPDAADALALALAFAAENGRPQLTPSKRV